MTADFEIDGRRFHDIPGFYAELNRVFMVGESWQLGISLDALDDMLHGSCGALNGMVSVRVFWRSSDKSAQDLGAEETVRWLEEKLGQPNTFNQDHVMKQLNAVTHGLGKTYFELVLEVFADHPNIELVRG